LGLDEFSMSAPSIPQVKRTLASLTIEEAQRVADTALKLPSAAAVRDYVASLK
jgi:phosphotransferase system enzyme I (PtsI)